MLYRAKRNGDEAVKSCKIVGNGDIYGYKLVDTYFVDNSGFGSESELALTFNRFLTKVKAGYFYGIREAGQFQVYIGEYKKIARHELKQEQAESGIVSSKIIKNNTRLTVYQNGDKVLRLHFTDIIKWQGNKIILNSGGWDTVTTRSRFNQFLPCGLRVYRCKGVTCVQDTRDENFKRVEFFDGIEL